MSQVDGLEQEERERFTLLSTALRDSHSKESAQAERTKYWSLGGSLIGACLGVIGWAKLFTRQSLVWYPRGRATV